jgi:hypothetical protein
MTRKDISDKLIHFTSDETIELAFRRLQKIIKERRILGTSNFVRGACKCVCFSEAPYINLPNGLVNPAYYSRYSPFGLMFPKKWIFEQGGRPVIYQTDQEFYSLPETLRWRHVRYEPHKDPPIDFTWEREWRMPRSVLEFGPQTATIIVSDRSWGQRLIDEHELDEEFKIAMYREAWDEDFADTLYEPFEWTILTLR